VKSLLALLIAAVGLSSLCQAADRIPDSVVKIYVTNRVPDFVRPWNKANPQEVSGSGVIIEGKRILTNAHVVSYASQVFVQGNQSSERMPAKVKFIAPGIDLAVVEVDNPSFFDSRPPLPLARDLPALKQAVNVYGYPVGGEQISVTQGIVSRIEHTSFYRHMLGLRIQIDAALNAGNSGGPAVADGKITGLVFSKFSAGENIGYLIAADELRMFLDDIRSGAYHGKPKLWVFLESTENQALRAKLGLEKEAGMMVSSLFGEAAAPLKKWDVILRIGDVPLDSKGNVKIKDDLRVHFNYLVPKLAKQGKVRLGVFRDRKPIELQVPVPAEQNFVMPFLLNKYPRYFVCGPMVFMPASQELAQQLSGYGAAFFLAAKNPMLGRTLDVQSVPGEEIVTLGAKLLPHKTSKGYNVQPFSVVTHVNGTAVRNLVHLVELLRDAKGEFLTIDLAGLAGSLVFRRQEALAATEDIIGDEGIRKQYSDDLEGVWHGKK
jgi:S1-C subfamily serine protease